MFVLSQFAFKGYCSSKNKGMNDFGHNIKID